MEILLTSKGDFTLYNKALDETYHSKNGAISEAYHVFIHPWLNESNTEILQQYHILEIGYGTGLNALITAKEATTHKLQVTYHSIEPYPLNSDILFKLGYGEQVGEEALFKKINECQWGVVEHINDHFSILKEEVQVQETILSPEKYDIVYFDAFGSKKQPEMWTYDVIEKISIAMKKGAMFLTYAATGNLNRHLKQLNFEVFHPAGANGKREMTLARKSITK